MKFPDKVYSILKWVAIIFMPALATFVSVVFPAWNIPYAEPIVVTINALATFLGICIGISTISYHKEK